MSSEAADRIRTKLKRELGPIAAHLDDPNTLEVMANPDGTVWVEKIGSGCVQHGTISESAARSIINTLSSFLDTATTAESPILEGELPLDGSRFEGCIPPVVMRPSFAIRKRASTVFSLEQYVDSSIITPRQEAEIIKAIETRKNIVISGGTGSGKTTLTNAIIAKITDTHPQDRIVTIEDTYEIQCSAVNTVQLHSTNLVSMQDLLKATMRLRPDRIIVGEVRGAEALALLKAWNTGHPGGVATLHANSPTAALTRLHHLTAEGLSNSEHVPELIAEAVDLVIQIAKTSTGRQVTGLAAIHSYRDGKYQFTDL